MIKDQDLYRQNGAQAWKFTALSIIEKKIQDSSSHCKICDSSYVPQSWGTYHSDHSDHMGYIYLNSTIL